MITEDYVSFETAKLLKEKRFDVKCEYCYAEFSKDDIEVIGLSPAKCAQSLKEDRYPYVTLQMAMKWLREVHNLHIEIYRTACGYRYIVSNIPYRTDLYSSMYEGDNEPSGQFTTNEKAVETALKYCLEHLI